MPNMLMDEFIIDIPLKPNECAKIEEYYIYGDSHDSGGNPIDG